MREQKCGQATCRVSNLRRIKRIRNGTRTARTASSRVTRGNIAFAHDKHDKRAALAPVNQLGVQKQRIRRTVAQIHGGYTVDFDFTGGQLRFRIDDENSKPVAISNWNSPAAIADWPDEELRQRILIYLEVGRSKR